MVHADGAFRMGRTHLVCQDYVAVAAGEFPCVLLADGCSSSPDTDVGARLLARSALSYAACLSDAVSRLDASPSLMPFWEQGPGVEGDLQTALQQYHQQAVCDAGSYAAALHLSETALDATLLTLMVCGQKWFASVFGDGVVAALNCAGELEVTVVSYLGGYPCYPNYLADAERRNAFFKQKDNLRQIETFRINAQGCVCDRRQETCSPDMACPFFMGDVEDYHWVAALSDGVHSFTTSKPGNCRVNVPLPVEEVLPELLAFKTFGGQFAQRRMQKFQQQCAARHWQHHDDVAMGVIVNAE